MNKGKEGEKQPGIEQEQYQVLRECRIVAME